MGILNKKNIIRNIMLVINICDSILHFSNKWFRIRHNYSVDSDVIIFYDYFLDNWDSAQNYSKI